MDFYIIIICFTVSFIMFPIIIVICYMMLMRRKRYFPQPKPIDRAKRLTSSSSSTEHDSSSFIKTVDSMTGEVIHKTEKYFNRPKEKLRKTKLTPVVTYAPVGYAKEPVSDKYESMTIATKEKEMTDETIDTNDERKKIKENPKPSYVQREPSDYDKGKDLRSPKAKGRNDV